MSDIAVSVKNLSKVYKLYDRHLDRLKEAVHPFKRKYHRPFYALKDVNFRLRKGEIMGVVGRNGAGKSTLLNLMAGVLTPSTGTVETDGKVSALLGLGTGFNPELTGIQNIYFNGTIMGYSKEEIDGRLQSILDFADIGDFIYQPLKVYSSGMKARLGFAAAIHIDPGILLLDEVLAVGDILFKRKCFAKMQELFSAGKTIVMASNSLTNIIQLCRRAILLDRGELLLDGPTQLVALHYQRLLYARPENQGNVRAEIIRLNQNEGEKRELSERMAQKGEAFFIPDFEPKSTSKDRIYDVDIFAAQVQTLAGEKVNALVMNETYAVCFKVRFNQALESVKFCLEVQNRRGIPISGIIIPKDEADNNLAVEAGATYMIKTRLKCTLLPETYYIGISVLTIDEKAERVPAIQINDALAFKVQEEKSLNYWGVVNLEQAGEVTRLS